MTADFEDTFKKELYKRQNEGKCILIPKDEYYQLLDRVKVAAAESGKKSRSDYYLLTKYEVLQCGDVEKLIRKKTDSSDPPIYFATIEETYDIVKRAHVATGHGGRDRMLKELQKKYANISIKTIELYKSYCVECQQKRKRVMTKGVVVRPILSKEFSSRGQVDLIDMQAMATSSYKWIMVYQDHLTKFCILRALSSKRAVEVASNLMDIFLMFGAPIILQSDNGSEFTSHVITELKLLWPEVNLVHGKPRHPQSQGSVERANGDIKDMLVSWMSENKSQEWNIGIKFVQFKKNSSYHAGIKCSPYSAMFGCDAKVGLTSSSLPHEVIQRLESESDLQNVLNGGDSSDANSNSQAASDTDSQIEQTDSQSEQTDSQSEHPESSNASNHDEMSDDIQTHKSKILKRRAEACSSQRVQAERMVKRSRVEMKSGEIGDNVAVPIPMVDRGRGDPRNILGVIVDRDLESDQYRIAVRAGILNGRYSRNQFDLCPQHLLTLNDVCQEKNILLRSEVTEESASGGQGFVKCSCSGAKRCQSNRCKCFKSKLLCNSRCHNSLNCCNK